MAKDPAVLWYYQDYLSGTEHMSFAEQGAYARLLNKQADIGHMSLQFIKSILKKDFTKLWPAVKEKFLTDENGLLYNERMDIEIEKRRKHSKKQADNILKRWNKSGIDSGITMVIPLENENEKNSIPGDSLKGESLTPYLAGSGLVPQMLRIYKLRFPSYAEDEKFDYPALLDIAWKIGKYLNIPKNKIVTEHAETVKVRWGEIVEWTEQDDWFSSKSIQFLNKHFQDVLQKFFKKPIVKSEGSSSAPVETIRERRDRETLESINGSGKGSTVSS